MKQVKVMNDSNIYGKCPQCEHNLFPVWFIEEEIKEVKWGNITTNIKTGRKRRAADYLLCNNCGRKVVVDDSFDGEWY